MLGALFKLLPLGLVVAGGMKVAQKKSRFVDLSQTVAAQAEISGIVKIIRLEAITGGFVPDAASFAAFLRQHMQVENAALARDVSLDAWGTGYRLEQRERRVHVKSAGPDRAFDTADDIGAAVDI